MSFCYQSLPVTFLTGLIDCFEKCLGLPWKNAILNKVVCAVLLRACVVGPDVERLADLAVDVPVGEPPCRGVLADLVGQVLHPPAAACSKTQSK